MEWMNDLLLALHETECCGIRATIVQIGDLHRRKREEREEFIEQITLMALVRAKSTVKIVLVLEQLILTGPHVVQARSISCD